jgi:hypothetical protein
LISPVSLDFDPDRGNQRNALKNRLSCFFSFFSFSGFKINRANRTNHTNQGDDGE